MRDRGRDVAVAERFALTRPSADVILSDMTPCAAQETEPGMLALTCAPLPGERERALTVRARFDSRTLAATVQRIGLDDPQLSRAWGDPLNRIGLTSRDAVSSGTWSQTVSRQDPTHVRQAGSSRR